MCRQSKRWMDLSDRDTVVFLTVKTHQRVPWLASPFVHETLTRIWKDPSNAWIVGTYILMPDHLHLFCSPRQVEVQIEAWITFWMRIFRRSHTHTEWRFQSRGWHHRLRNNENRENYWRYMIENPLRKGLVRHPSEWLYQGKIFDLW